MVNFERERKKVPFLVLDGAMGTELAARGFDTDDALWSAKALFEQPALICAIHAAYYAAGADISTSASYQATVEGFEKKGFDRKEAKELMLRSVKLTREARDAAAKTRAANLPHPMVAASIGPYGAYLADGSEYRGDYTIDRKELADFHAERLSLLNEAAPDLFACETIPLLAEAEAVLEDLAKYAPEIPAWLSFSCKDGAHISSGESAAEAAAMVEQYPQAVAVGINCTAPEHVAGLIEQMRTHTTKPIVVYPNSGESYDAAAKTWCGSPTPYQTFIATWYEAGAALIGGCCRTRPKDIADIAAFRAGLLS